MPKKIELNERIEKFINKCVGHNIQLNQTDIKDISHTFEILYKDTRITNKRGIDRTLYDILLYDTKRKSNNFCDRILELKLKKGVTLHRLKLHYGEEEGLKRWNDYVEKQRVTNTFEYKNKKYNMTREEFDSYNKKRSCCKENFILRYGEEEGLKRWNDYVEKQKIHGSCEEWFIEKLGEEEGLKRWNKINFYKSRSVPSLIERLNISEEEAIKLIEEDFNKHQRKNFYSKISQKLFWQLYEILKNDFNNIYFAELNHEFGKYSKEMKKYCLYDFVISDIKFCIEFQGDNYHGNPKFYKPSDKLRAVGVTNVTVKDIWEEDAKKKNTLLKYGYDLIYVWENDYIENEEKVLESCINRIMKLKKEQISQSSLLV